MGDDTPRRGHTPKGSVEGDLAGLPAQAYALFPLGTKTQAVVRKHKGFLVKLLSPADQELISLLAATLGSEGWHDTEASAVLDAYFSAASSGRQIKAEAFIRWIHSHKNDPKSVVDCLEIIPPENIEITRVLSRAGSQKLVFQGTLGVTADEIVLKTIIGDDEVRKEILDRQSQANPISMDHKNIIKTFILKNSRGDPFLVERYLPTVLSDSWRAAGIDEAANLLYDLATALSYLHDSLKGVHGDVKPDNIAKDGKEFVLLDFGVYRTISKFRALSSPTGSLKTRAPEVLVAGTYPVPDRVDVWALGASVFNALLGRYPLFEQHEAGKREGTGITREAFESLLRRRAEAEYDRWVNLDGIEQPLRSVLESALHRTPDKRYTASELVKQCQERLAAFLISPDTRGQFSEVEELSIYEKYLPSDAGAVRLMPRDRKQLLLLRLSKMERREGLTDSQLRFIRELKRLLEAQ